MPAKKVTIKIVNLANDFQNVVQILYHYHKAFTIWNTHHGSNNRDNLRTWENRAEKFLSERVEIEFEPESNPDPDIIGKSQTKSDTDEQN